MRYRKDEISGNELSVLGLGCMRFPGKKAEAQRIVSAAIEGGVNFFDTAYLYPGNEKMLGAILENLGKRGDVYIATKLPVAICKNANDFNKYFAVQLERLRTDYIDYYFMHNLTSFAQWEALRELGIERWLAEKKESGQLRRVGFSYHGTCDDFLKILDSYPWEFCMIQYNYCGENYQAGKKGLQAAGEKGIPVIIMEPLLGGKLATGLPKQAVEMLAKANPTLTPADWALWWLWNQSEVTVVLSGMNTPQQMESNLYSADSFRPLTDEELPVYADVVELLKKSHKIPCTGCNYCLPCPVGINIPACLSAYNASYVQGYKTGMTLYMTSIAVLTKNPGSPRVCNRCGKCEKACPQFIPIRKELKRVSRRFEPLPVRLAVAVARRIIAR